MKVTMFFAALGILIVSCKKAGNEEATPAATDKCGGRYDKEVFASVNINLNIKYGTALSLTGEQEDLLLDLYEPGADTAKKRALIIFAHGGGWTSGTKMQGKDFCTLFAKKGYVAASINYRLGIENPVNDKTRGEAVYRGVQDIKAAIRYGRANAALLKIDTSQIFIGGYSAGAVNAIHAAFWNEGEISADIDKIHWGNLEGSGGNPGSSSRISGVYGIAGAIANLNWIQTGEPPILCINSKTDHTIPYNNGKDGSGIFVYGGASIVPKAASLNNSAILFTYDNIAHGDYLQAENFLTTTNAVSSFLYSKVRCQ